MTGVSFADFRFLAIFAAAVAGLGVLVFAGLRLIAWWDDKTAGNWNRGYQYGVEQGRLYERSLKGQESLREGRNIGEPTPDTGPPYDA